MKYIKKFSEISMRDVGAVGGKNASLGEMIRGLEKKNIRIPQGFAITAAGYWRFVDHNGIAEIITSLLRKSSSASIKQLQSIAHELQQLFMHGSMPPDLQQEIIRSYKELSKLYHVKNCDVAVRSSATAEDLPGASFAGQQETFLHIHGIPSLLEACKNCFASLFTQRAIIYRNEKGFGHLAVALSIGVQKMVRSDRACSGVMFTLDPETGFKDVVVINGSYGLGETIVQGDVTPDEFVVFKPALLQGYKPIIKKELGDKDIKAVYSSSKKEHIEYKRVPQEQREQFCLQDSEILDLARMGYEIELYYADKNKKWSPMDIEWAKDGNDELLYIVQARPETVHSQHPQRLEYSSYVLTEKRPKNYIAHGLSIGRRIISGKARFVKNPSQAKRLQPDDILITQMTNPDWVSVMKKVAGIITMRGGRTCHAAIVSRELNIPAIVGVAQAQKVIKQGQHITIDCSQGNIGYIYDGALKFEEQKIVVHDLPQPPVSLLVNIAQPDTVFTVAQLPLDGVGLARIEFIIANAIKIHPLALIEFDKVRDKKIKKEIMALTAAYKNKQDFFIDTLAQGIGMIAAAFYPKPVIVRTSDFKTNEYRDLLGGSYFEPFEENPMLGLRGASRYLHPAFKKAFALECAAIKKVRSTMGLTNVICLVPFVRTVAEGEKVITLMKQCGLEKGKDGLQIFMMCELPANVLLIDQFSKHFDGFSIGSNDLAQLMLGVDRDSALVADLFDERNPAVTLMFEQAVKGARRAHKKIGICGQAPSDYPEIAQLLIDNHIDSISLNQDAIIPYLMRLKRTKMSKK